MRPFLFTLFLLISYPLFARNTTFEKLQSVNRYWAQQPDVGRTALPECNEHSRTDLIKLHLALVEQTLRKRDLSSLSATQRKNRLAALDHLHKYMLAGRFPQNEDYNYPTPIFIDKHDNFCAVGYLVKATGHEAISRMIAAKTNLAYVADMKYPELFAWAKEYGFTVSELEWIQPTYSPPNYSAYGTVGKGVDSTINEMFVDTVNDILYVGGNFTKSDTLTVNHITSVTENAGVYTWNRLSSGLDGPVYAITKFGSNIFVGGAFAHAGGYTAQNIAYWDGNLWHSAGCINGTVKDLFVFHGNLYASGNFALCSSTSPVNLAKWDGNNWIGIPGISGTINVMTAHDTDLILGGRFSYSSSDVNVIKWNETSGFRTFASNIANEVKDFSVLQDTLYAGCKQIATGSKDIVFSLINNTWTTAFNAAPLGSTDTLSFNSLFAHNKILIGAGDIYLYSLDVFNMYFPKSNSDYFEHWLPTDGPINKMISLNGKIICGGRFMHGRYASPILNNIAVYDPNIAPLSAKFSVKNVCTNSPGAATVSVSGGVKPFRYLWSNGDTDVTATNLSNATYSVIITDDEGRKDTATVAMSLVTIDTTLTYIGTMLVAKVADSFAWLDCNSNTIIPNEMLPEYTPTKTGAYAVIMSIQGCKDTSACYADTITTIDIADIHGSNLLKVYPNPVIKELNVKMQEGSYTELSITDMAGRVLKHEVVNKAVDHLSINAGDLPQGIYLLVLKDATGNQTIRKFNKE